MLLFGVVRQPAILPPQNDGDFEELSDKTIDVFGNPYLQGPGYRAAKSISKALEYGHLGLSGGGGR